MDPHRHAATDLQRAVTAIGRTQGVWLADLENTCAGGGDPRFIAAFHRWEETLTLLKLQLHRAEAQMRRFLVVPEAQRPPWRDLPGPTAPVEEHYHRFYDLVAPYFRTLHLETHYRRLTDVGDLQAEAVSADIVTDFVALAECAAGTAEALSRCEGLALVDGLEEIAYYHVLSPWKHRGLPALMDVCRWLRCYVVENEEL